MLIPEGASGVPSTKRPLGHMALVPLVLLLFTGLYLFVLPYATKWRSRRRTTRSLSAS